MPADRDCRERLRVTEETEFMSLDHASAKPNERMAAHLEAEMGAVEQMIRERMA